MTLAPKLPPGRANRKALQYMLDIHRLRRAGYTFSAIRAALLDVGVHVSLTTIKREAAREEASDIGLQQTDSTQELSAATAQTPAPEGSMPPALLIAPRATGREIAEAFFSAHPSNPLFPTKEKT